MISINGGDQQRLEITDPVLKTRPYIITSGVITIVFITCCWYNFNYIRKNTAYTKSYSSQFLT